MRLTYFTSKRKTLNHAVGLNQLLVIYELSTEVCKRLSHSGITANQYISS